MPTVTHNFPADYDPADNVCLKVPRALASDLASLLSQWLWRASWIEGDHEQGYQAALLLMERLLQECDVSCECDELLIPETIYYRLSLSDTGQLYYRSGGLRWQPAASVEREVVTSYGWYPIDSGPNYGTRTGDWPSFGYKQYGDLVRLQGVLDAKNAQTSVVQLPAPARPLYNERQLISRWRSGTGWHSAVCEIHPNGWMYLLYGQSGDLNIINVMYERVT
jgi:hypothetical protein